MYKDLTSYQSFKTICTAKKLHIQHNFSQETERSDKYYEIYAYDENVRYECHINSVDDSALIADYESNVSPDANYNIRSVDDFGNQLVSPTLDDSLGLTPKKKTHKHSVVAGQINIFDVPVTTERRINGGEYWICEGFASSVHADDYIEFSVVDKDNILGLFDSYGLIEGSDILELSKFVITDYVKKGDPITGYHTQCFEGITGTSKVFQGLYYRIMYDSAGEDDLYFLERIYYYE